MQKGVIRCDAQPFSENICWLVGGASTWKRNEARNDLILNSMTINFDMFGPLMKNRVACIEDGSLVVIGERHRT